MNLNYQVFGESGRALLLVHGLFGQIANWRSVARELSTDYRVYVVDQRNHGESFHSGSMTYHDMATDLDQFIIEHQLDEFILCGHSMGGKAAMVYALSDDMQSVDRMDSMIVLDIAPVQYSHSHAPYLAALSKIDLSQIQSRAQVEKLLQPEISDDATRFFLMQSLVKKENGFQWKLNLPVLQRYMPEIVGFPEKELVGHDSQVKTLFLYGSKSDYVTKYMYSGISEYFKNVQFDSVEAGHWLHVEQRQAIIESIKDFLK